MKKVLIFGAGISGLAAANKLSKSGYDVEVYEKDSMIGGLSGTYNDDGYIYDKGPHYFFSSLAEKVGMLNECERVPYYESICYKNKYYSFPFGLLANPNFFISVSLAFVKRMITKEKDYINLKDLLLTNYGRTFTGKILAPLIEKWAGVDTKEISCDFGKRLLPGNIKYVLYSLIKKIRGYTEDYYQKGRYMVYPKGGMKTVFDTLQSNCDFRVFLNSEIEEITINDDAVERVKINSKFRNADYFISTIPVNNLVELTKSHNLIQNSLSEFKYRGIVLLYLKTKPIKAFEKLWYWFPENKYPFYRISQQINTELGKIDHEDTNRVIIFEYGSFPKDDLWELKDSDIFNISLSHLVKLFNFNESLIVGYRVERIPAAYPILMKSYENIQRMISHDIGIKNLFLAGRTGMFKYHMLEESYDSAIEVADYIITKL